MNLPLPLTLRSWLPASFALALLAGAPLTDVQAQALFNGAGNEFTIADSVVYVPGTVQNAGTLRLTAGRLLIDGGDLISTGTLAGTAGRVRLDGGATGRTVTLSAQTLPRLDLNVPQNTTLGSDGTISGALNLLSGHLLTTAAFALRLTPGAVINGETNARYVRGTVVQTRTISGAAPVDFGQMGVTVNPAGQTITGLQVERRAGTNSLNNSFGQNPNFAANTGIDRIWRLSTTGNVNPAAPVTITLNWLSDNDNGLTASLAQAQVWRSIDNGATWQAQNALQNGSARSVTITPTLLNAWYTVSTNQKPLPVELISFTAAPRNRDGLLNWATASEKNSAYFAIERSSDGQRWTEKGKVDALGTSTQRHNYNFVDRNAANAGDTWYYRLRQVDTDGTTTYSNVELVRFNTPKLTLALAAYPVPLQTWVNLDITAPITGPLAVTLIDATGRTVLTRELAATAGLNTWRLDVPTSLAAGTYVLRATLGTESVSKRVTREK